MLRAKWWACLLCAANFHKKAVAELVAAEKAAKNQAAEALCQMHSSPPPSSSQKRASGDSAQQGTPSRRQRVTPQHAGGSGGAAAGSGGASASRHGSLLQDAASPRDQHQPRPAGPPTSSAAAPPRQALTQQALGAPGPGASQAGRGVFKGASKAPLLSHGAGQAGPVDRGVVRGGAGTSPRLSAPPHGGSLASFTRKLAGVQLSTQSSAAHPPPLQQPTQSPQGPPPAL